MQLFTDKNKNILKTVKMEKETFLPYCLGSMGKKHLEGENFRGSVLVHKVFHYFWPMWRKPSCLLNLSYLNMIGAVFPGVWTVQGLLSLSLVPPDQCFSLIYFWSMNGSLALFRLCVYVCVCFHKKLVYLCWLPDSIILHIILFGTVMPGFIPVIERFPSDLRPRSPS